MHPSNIVVPTLLPLIAAIISIAVKEGLYWYTIIAAKKINSVSLKAEAWHHRSDAFSSIGSLVGILGARLGYPVFDPIASVIIAVFIVKVAINIFTETMKWLAANGKCVIIVTHSSYVAGCADERIELKTMKKSAPAS